LTQEEDDDSEHEKSGVLPAPPLQCTFSCKTFCVPEEHDTVAEDPAVGTTTTPVPESPIPARGDTAQAPPVPAPAPPSAKSPVKGKQRKPRAAAKKKTAAAKVENHGSLNFFLIFCLGNPRRIPRLRARLAHPAKVTSMTARKKMAKLERPALPRENMACQVNNKIQYLPLF
jgi:hypothetical protein